MTSTHGNLSTNTENLSPSDDLWPEASAEQLAKRELVKAQCVEEYSSSPLYQARAAKDPEFWNWFCNGAPPS